MAVHLFRELVSYAIQSAGFSERPCTKFQTDKHLSRYLPRRAATRVGYFIRTNIYTHVKLIYPRSL